MTCRSEKAAVSGDHFQFRDGEVVGINTGVIHFFKANNNGILDPALVNGGNLADFPVPVRLFAKNPNVITTINHE
jgi:quercetin dioxygenase-like cupin family protein